MDSILIRALSSVAVSEPQPAKVPHSVFYLDNLTVTQIFTAPCEVSPSGWGNRLQVACFQFLPVPNLYGMQALSIYKCKDKLVSFNKYKHQCQFTSQPKSFLCAAVFLLVLCCYGERKQKWAPVFTMPGTENIASMSSFRLLSGFLLA